MRRLNPHLIALLGGVLVVVLLLAYVASTRGSNPDKLKDTQVATSQPRAAPEKRCASQATYDLIKRELFRRAAQVRGSDQAAYDQLAGYAVVRMESPVMESSDSQAGSVSCSGSLSLDLPPGIAVVGGRRTLSSDVDYSVQPAADGSGNVVLLRNADAIITPLATLARTAQETPQATAQPPLAPAVPPTTSAPTAQPAPTAPAPTPQSASARPSFDCRTARTRGEVAVCSDSGLAALDRSMASQYAGAVADASPDQQALLRETAHRFYRYRDSCPDNRCIGDAYNGRMREIRDIMQGRWQPPR